MNYFVAINGRRLVLGVQYMSIECDNMQAHCPNRLSHVMSKQAIYKSTIRKQRHSMHRGDVLLSAGKGRRRQWCGNCCFDQT